MHDEMDPILADEHKRSVKRKKRVEASIGEKLCVVQQFKTAQHENPDLSVSEFASGFNADRTTVSCWIGKENTYVDYLKIVPCDSRSRMQISAFHIIEKALLLWLQTVRNGRRKVAISGFIVRFQAIQFYELMKEYVDLPLDFQASYGWLNHFKKRHNIKNWKLHGEAASVNQSDVEEGRRILKELLSNWGLNQIYNTDETGLFYCQPPRQSLDITKQSGEKEEKDRFYCVSIF
jgi:hypothetical protein